MNGISWSGQIRGLIVIPAFNESEGLKEQLHDVWAVLRQWPLGRMKSMDILVVDDGSTDNTSVIAREAGVLVARHAVNLGAGAASQTGYRYALKHGYNLVLHIDGDGQHPPQSLGAMLDFYDSQPVDCVIGSRFLQGATSPMSLVRRCGNRVVSLVVSRLSGQRVTDSTSGMRILGERALRVWACDYPVDFPDAEALLILADAGCTWAEMPVVMEPRRSGTSMFTPARMLYYPFKILVVLIGILVFRLSRRQ